MLVNPGAEKFKAHLEFRLEQLGCQKGRIDNILVPGTATYIARERVTQFGFGRIGVLAQVGDKGEQKAGCTITTLQAVLLPKGLLNGVQILRLAQPLYGRDRVAVGLHGKHDAGTHGFAIQKNRTRAARPMLAADMGSRQVQFMTNQIAQQ